MAQTTPKNEADSYPLVVPAGKTAKELVEYAEKALRVPINAKNRDEALEFINKRAAFACDAAEAAMKMNPEKEIIPNVMMMKMGGLLHFAVTNQPGAGEKLDDFLVEIDRVLPNSQESKIARLLNLQRIAAPLETKPSIETFVKLKNAMFTLVQQEPIGFPPDIISTVIDLTRLGADSLKKPELVDQTTKELEVILQNSSNPALKEMAKSIPIVARTLGVEWNIAGLTLDDKSIDIKNLRGKYVLVDFFATWCGPCIAEIPALKAIYAKYHDKGLDIIGVGQDDPKALKELVKREKISWPIISEEMMMAKGMPALSETFVIQLIPSVFLFDPDGKLILSDARGEKLSKKLNDIFEKTK
ncbi:MAG: peroxiredoxin family protein [Thermoguttaceae bacterium]